MNNIVRSRLVEYANQIINTPRLWLIAVLVACFALLQQGSVAAIDKNSLEIDVQNFFYDYKENGGSINGQPMNSKELGWLNGLRLSYARINPDSDRDFRINAFISHGTTNYTGNYNSQSSTGVSDNLIMALEVLTMYDYIKVIESQLYFGLGYRRWQLGINANDNNSEINEVYSWLYVPVGLRHMHQFSADLSCEIDLSARMMLAGTLSASNIQLQGQSYNADMKLGSQFGVDLRVPFSYRMSKEFSLVVTPWADYSQMAAGNSVNIANTSYQVIGPPGSNWQFGSDVGIRYTF